MNKIKRKRITTIPHASPPLTIRQYTESKNGVLYESYLVQGWKINGKWQRRKFKTIEDAERFIALQRVNQDLQEPLQMKLTQLSSRQIGEAEHSFQRLGENYTLSQAVDFFLKHHRSAEFKITLSEALSIYLKSRKNDGTRERTLKQTANVLKLFISASTNLLVSDVSKETATSFLESLKSRDGQSKAKRKTWNNYRNDLNQFFEWSRQADLATSRPWICFNPVTDILHYTAKQVAEQNASIISTTSVDDVVSIMKGLQHWKEGKMVKYYALAYFAGIRPEGELVKLSSQEKELINLETDTITIPASISKTKSTRQIHITPNLKKWLVDYVDFPIVPKNVQKLRKIVKGAYNISHDETRHSFISYHIGLHRSVGDAALQAGNSESIIKKHYLKLHTKKESYRFFSISP